LEDSKRKSNRVFEILILVAVVVAIVVVLSWGSGKPVTEVMEVKSQLDRQPPKEPEAPGDHEFVYLPFRNASEGLPPKGKWRGDPAAADVNHDGNLDVIASLRMFTPEMPENRSRSAPPKPSARDKENRPESGLYVFLGDGKGNWTQSIEGITKGQGYGGSEVADFNHDGHPDIAFSTHRGPVAVYLGDGKGAWFPSSEGIDNPTVIHDLTAADFTGDGYSDIVALSMFPDNDGRIYCFENMGDATWKRMHEEPLMAKETFGLDICHTDIDRDGDMDFIATTELGLKVFINDGTGQFEDQSMGLPRPSIGNSLTSVDAGDINGDGDLEIVVGAFQSSDQPGLEVYERVDPEKEEGLYWKRLYEGPYRKDYTFGLALGDMDGDNDLDLVVASNSFEYSSRITVYENDGTGKMIERGRIKGATGRSTVDLADFNNDGKLDVLTVFSANDGGVRVYLQE
jgi:hypothetical protein